MIFGNVDKFAIYVEDINQKLTKVLVYLDGIPIGTEQSQTFLPGFIQSAKFFSQSSELPDFMKNLSDAEKLKLARGDSDLNGSENDILIANEFIVSSWAETFDDFLIMKYKQEQKIIFLWKLIETEGYKFHFTYPSKFINKLHKSTIEQSDIEREVKELLECVEKSNGRSDS